MDFVTIDEYPCDEQKDATNVGCQVSIHPCLNQFESTTECIIPRLRISYVERSRTLTKKRERFTERVQRNQRVFLRLCHNRRIHCLADDVNCQRVNVTVFGDTS